MREAVAEQRFWHARRTVQRTFVKAAATGPPMLYPLYGFIRL